MSLLKLIILINHCSLLAVSYEIFWKLAAYRETQVETCARNGLKPLSMDSMDIAWNASMINHITKDILNLPLISNVSNDYGILGCCVPSLWCTSDGCFTQSYGSKYVNYGWLETFSAAKPVYTCHNTTTLGGEMKLNSVVRSGSNLFIYGANLGSEQSNLDVSVHGSSCSKAELCNCHTCSSSQTCSLDSRCYQNYCFKTCAGTGDASCPCNQVCQNVADSSGLYVSLCLPSSFSSYANNCASRGSDQLMCSANSTIYGQSYSSTQNITVGVVLDTEGSTAKVTSLSQTCTSNAQCYDGNICTEDVCTNNYCVYTPTKECDSILPSIQDSFTPYSYNTLSITNATAQTLFVTQLQSVATTITTLNWNNKQVYDVTTLPFWFLYFGNLVKKVYITSTGSLSFPPMATCSTQECLLFTSFTNTFAPWFSKQWVQGKVLKYVQTKDQLPYLHNINTNAFHVLFQGMKTSANQSISNTFAASVYSDGSLRASYVQGLPTIGSNFTNEYAGLWGAFQSTQTASYLRYHQENTSLLMTQDQDLVYCPVNTTACLPETCVAAGTYVHIQWNGTDSCTALNMEEYSVSLSCQWHGGLNSSQASMITRTSASTASGILSCLVPFMALEDGSIVPLRIVTTIRHKATQTIVPFLSNDHEENKIIYGVQLGISNELTRANLMIRYYQHNQSVPGTCGCNPLSTYAGNQCSSQGVCAASSAATTASSAVVDCAQTPFGSAFFDACNTCAGGYTKNIPTFSCDSSSGSGSYDLLTQTIILLTVICCLTFITSAISFSIRRMLLNQAQQTDLLAEHMIADLLEMANTNNRNSTSDRPRGLSEFECDAIGLTTFTKEFYLQHKKQMEKHHTPAMTTKPPAQEVIDFSGDVENKDSEDIETQTSTKEDICECAICLMEIQEGNTCRVLPDPCGHIFHQSCIDEWFKQSVACPMCKRSMRTLMHLEDELAGPSLADNQLPYRGFTFTIRHPNNEHPAIRWVLNLDDLNRNILTNATTNTNTNGPGPGAANLARNNSRNNFDNQGAPLAREYASENAFLNPPPHTSAYSRLASRGVEEEETIHEDDIETPRP